MNRKKGYLMSPVITLLLISSSISSMAQDNKTASPLPASGKIYVNANVGDNNNNGTQGSPLLTLDEAAKRVNSSKGSGAITVFLSKGVYGLANTAAFNPVNWKLSKQNRLTIRAEVLPDDSNWSHAEMPVLISTMPFLEEKNDKNEVTGAQNFGILIQNISCYYSGAQDLRGAGS